MATILDTAYRARHRRQRHRRPGWLSLSGVLVLTAALVLACTSPATPAPAQTSAGQSALATIQTRVADAAWGARAAEAIDFTIDLDDGSESAFSYAFLAGAIGHRYGWDDPRVQTYLNKVYAQRLASGGYGLDYSWDAFQDGSTNPATTTYTITTTGQVGRVMLEGYKAGVVPREEVVRLVQATMAIPRSRVGGPGICLSYSNQVADGAYCVPNIVASAGQFLYEAKRAGVYIPGQQRLIAGLAQRDASYYRQDGFWPYMQGQTTAQDWNHNAVNAEAEMVLSPPIGEEAVAVMMGRTTPPAWYDPMGQIALLPYSCGYADDLLDEFDAFMDHPGVVTQWAAQAAYWSARAAALC